MSFIDETSVDPDGLQEFSVVYSDRSLNHMSDKFIKIMQYINQTLKHVYNAKAAILVNRKLHSHTFTFHSHSLSFSLVLRFPEAGVLAWKQWQGNSAMGNTA